MSQQKTPISKLLIGTDIYLNWSSDSVENLAEELNEVAQELILTRITNRGVKVWSVAADNEESTYTDYWKCRFMGDKEGKSIITPAQIIMLLARVNGAGFDIVKVENLYIINGKVSSFVDLE